ncbi:MAG: DUF839 domain-containing protein [Alphaproteobacteria bacterium]|nr:DUF839 domain-containing protein [Alphaproteobacteria bacterium]
MTDLPVATRRQALKLLAGAPMLPLGAASLASLMAGGAPAALAAGTAKFVSAKFTGMPAPTLADPAAMAATTVGSRLAVKMSDGSTHDFKLTYHPFFVTGDSVPDGKGGTILAGGYYDIAHKPIIDRSVPGKERQMFSDSPDGTSLLSLPNAKVPGVAGKPVFAVVQFEYNSRDQSGADTYGILPSPIAVLTLDQDPRTGHLKLVKYHNVDTSAVHALWITCGASLSPWNTHLSSEEYEPDAFFPNKTFKAYSKIVFGDETMANPYHYGHLPEVTVHPDGTGSIKKHYNLGRISRELAQVMPDERTVLFGDDINNGGLFLFVADKARDLSAGTLYVAKYGPGFSVDPAAPAATLAWIRLGHATSRDIEGLASQLKPADIMDVALEDPKAPGFTKIWYGGKENWVRLKPGMEKAAAFLETHRYAALVGASMALTKLEGTTVNIKDKVAYSAISYARDTMVKGSKGWYPESNIALDKRLMAGAVAAHDLKGGQKDTSGAAIKSEWVPVLSKTLLAGEDISPDALGNTAHADKIANPDNLKFSEKLRTLFIGEDSGMHVNNFLWAYNVDTKELTRILSTPAGAESTGLHAVDELNGWTYIMSNFQHPGDWEKGLHDKVKDTLDPLVRANWKDRFGAAVGYITADPTSLKLSRL